MYLVAISGASSGIGRSLAIEALARGHRVALMDLNIDALCDIKSEFGNDRCLIMQGDTSSPDHVNDFAQMISSSNTMLKFAFANAGILRSGGIIDSPLDHFEVLFRVNTIGSIIFAKSLVPLLERCDSRSYMTFTSSSSMLRATANFGAYSASKHAVLAIAEALDMELKIRGSNVSVAVLCPAAVKTAIAEGNNSEIIQLRNRIAERGIAPSELAHLAFDQITSGKSCIFTDNRTALMGIERMEALSSGHFIHQR